MKKAPIKNSYTLASACNAAEKYADMAGMDKRDILADLEQCTVNADTEDKHQATTAVARAQCLLLALARKIGMSHEGIVTMASQWAGLQCEMLKAKREAQV